VKPELPAKVLNPLTHAQLCSVFARYPAIDKVVLFGSRALGSHHERSDIDLAAYGSAIDRHTLAAVLLDIDDLDTPLKVDLQSGDEIRNAKLKDHIRRVGKVLYARQA